MGVVPVVPLRFLCGSHVRFSRGEAEEDTFTPDASRAVWLFTPSVSRAASLSTTHSEGFHIGDAATKN